MRQILIIIIFSGLLSCIKPVVNGNFSPPAPFRLIVLDSLDNNLLDPSIHSNFNIKNLQFDTGANLKFKLKNTIGGSNIGFYFIESLWVIGDSFDPESWNCVNSECEFYIIYSNSADKDTISLMYEEVTANENSEQVVAYPRKYIKLNGTDIDEFESEFTGAAIIRK